MHINTCVDWCNVAADNYLITLKYYPSTVHMYPTSLAVLCSTSNTQAGKMYIHRTHVFTCVRNYTTKHWSTFFLLVQSKVVVMT